MAKTTELRDNSAQLVEMAVQGAVIPPRFFNWEPGHNGVPIALPSVGGIVYNVKLGDSVFGLMGDHIEPGVSAAAGTEKLRDDPNRAFNALSCIGNEVRILGGDAKGEGGTVVGHHGGVEHVMIDFAATTLEKLTHDDKLQIRCVGLGLTLLDFLDVTLSGLSPRLLAAMQLSASGGALTVPVTAVIPPLLMGSGLGSAHPYMGDFDIQTSDATVLKEHKLNGLRFGDIVAIADYQCHFGYSFLKGALTIGVIVHSDSFLAGHGPGVQVIMTSRTAGRLLPKIVADANVGAYLKLGRWRESETAPR